MSNRRSVLAVVAGTSAVGWMLLAAAPAAAATRYIGATASDEVLLAYTGPAARETQFEARSFKRNTYTYALRPPDAVGRVTVNSPQMMQSVAAVPEVPGSATGGMVLAGLGLLGMIARRRTFLR